MNNRLIKSNDAGGGGCTNTVNLYNPFPDGGGVALYQLNGDATDVSGNYDGNFVNPAYTTGVFGQAGVFNGSSSLVDLGTNTFSFTEVTVSMWVKFDSFTGTDCLFDGYYEAASVAYGYVCLSDSNNKVKFRSYNYPNYTDTVSETSLSTGVWYHLAFVSNQSQASVYINGVLDATGSTVGISTNTNTRFTIGAFRYAPGTVNYFDGSIDQVRIFSRALRPYEVEALYTEEYCTPTIVPSEHFTAITYEGTGTTQSTNSLLNQVGSVDFQPDLVWIKDRDGGDNHVLQDSIRGVNSVLFSNLRNAESGDTNNITSFDSNGFSIGASTRVNANGENHVAWNFKAGGAAVTISGNNISNASRSANTDSGFSIIKFTSNGNTINAPHGLNQTPELVITKSTNNIRDWYTWFKDFNQSEILQLNDARAVRTVTNFWNSIPDSTNVYYDASQNNNLDEFVFYCFHSVEGFSNFGSYVGTGNTVNVVTGFEPAMIIIKRTDSIEDWKIIDNKRGFANSLEPNESIAEETGNNSNFVLSENGFTIGDTSGDYNANGGSYIYMAFAADPTTIEPSLEDSFNTVLYTGNGGTQSITGVGFQPDLLWIKERTDVSGHQLRDSVRGVSNFLSSQNTSAEVSNTNVTSFDNNGFTVGVSNGTNQSGENYVSWNWKGAELPAINSNGSIPSVVSANRAAGFSIVSWASTSTTSTIGHGLESTPSIIFMKSRTNTGDWQVYSSEIGATKKLFLNDTNAATSSGVWGNTSPNENVFTSAFNSVGNVIAYCFAEVAGFSKFGSYNGTNSVGNKQTMDFEPAFVLIKPSNVGGSWVIFDNKRNTTNPRTKFIRTNTADVEGTSTGLDFYTDGFDFNGSNLNVSGYSYIYMAFANQF